MCKDVNNVMEKHDVNGSMGEDRFHRDGDPMTGS
jgi:hypothetical protein